MEEISNRALAVLLVAAIIVSLGGTIISLNKVGQLGVSGITGFATTDQGYVNLSVAAGVSITTADSNRINFGACTPAGGGFVVIGSEANASHCAGGDVGSTNSKNITVRNNGNVHVNLTMVPNNAGEKDGGTYLPGPSDNSWIAIKSDLGFAGGYANGCTNNTVIMINSSIGHTGIDAVGIPLWRTYRNITASATNITICANLTASATANSVGVYVQLGLPQDAATGASTVTFAFTGEAI